MQKNDTEIHTGTHKEHCIITTGIYTIIIWIADRFYWLVKDRRSD